VSTLVEGLSTVQPGEGGTGSDTKLPFSIVYVPMLRLWALFFIWSLGRRIPKDN